MKAALLALLMLVPPLAATAATTSARAATTEEIFAVYAHGDYEQAARLGEASHTAPGLAIAARAVLADEVLRDTPCLSCLERAEALARQAVVIDPHFAFGQVWLAVSLGYQARIIGIVKARLKNSPAQSRAALDTAVLDDPQNPFAVSALGGWHIEVVRGGGAYLARIIYDAREKDALALFDRAVRLAPDNVAVHYQIGLALAGFDPEKYHARIAAEFHAAQTAAAATAYEKKMQIRAGELLGLSNQLAHDAFELRVRKYQGFPD
jgi:tetratricopeptide (TPR) repeat protein